MTRLAIVTCIELLVRGPLSELNVPLTSLFEDGQTQFSVKEATPQASVLMSESALLTHRLLLSPASCGRTTSPALAAPRLSRMTPEIDTEPCSELLLQRTSILSGRRLKVHFLPSVSVAAATYFAFLTALQRPISRPPTSDPLGASLDHEESNSVKP